MSVIAFRPRSTPTRVPTTTDHPAVHGTFRSPRGRSGWMTGSLRVGRLIMAPRGAFVTGVFTGELREDDGSLIGIESRGATAAVDLVYEGHGFRPWVRPFTLDFMGITVEVSAFPVDPVLALPSLHPLSRRPHAVPPQPPAGPAS